MRLVVQRVTSARVEVEGSTVGSIDGGLVVLIGVRIGDTPESARLLAERVSRLRIFSDDEGKMNRSVTEAGGRVLVVSQFTLYGDTRGGNRPSFVEAAPPEVASELISGFISALGEEGLEVAEGMFGAHMKLTLTNDGPVTIILEA